MVSDLKALVFDVGGVLLDWDRQNLVAISPEQFLVISNSTAWHGLERGNVTLKEACQVTTFSLGCIETIN